MNNQNNTGYELWYAPMCHLSGLAYRQLLRQYFPEIRCVTQMYSAKGIIFSEMYSEIRQNLLENEQTIVQIYGSSEQEIVDAGNILFEKIEFLRGIDVNFGCPAECAKEELYGYYFAGDILKVMKRLKQQNNNQFISCKLRLRQTIEENCMLLQGLYESNIDQVIIHCRKQPLANSSSQQEQPDYQMLMNSVKQFELQLQNQNSNHTMKIIVNGGIKTCQQGIHLIDQFDSKFVKGFMVGSAFLDNPQLCESQLSKRGNQYFDYIITNQQQLILEHLTKISELNDVDFLQQIRNFDVNTINLTNSQLIDNSNINYDAQQLISMPTNQQTYKMKDLSVNQIQSKQQQSNCQIIESNNSNNTDIVNTIFSQKTKYLHCRRQFLVIPAILFCFFFLKQQKTTQDLKEKQRHIHLLAGKIVNSQQEILKIMRILLNEYKSSVKSKIKDEIGKDKTDEE